MFAIGDPNESGHNEHMSTANQQYKRSKPRQRTSPAKRVVLSPEAKEAYETLAQDREERGRNYDRHLPSDKKGK